MKKTPKKKTRTIASQYRLYFREGFARGIGWAFGVTVGFALVSFLVAAVLSRFMSFPIIGDFVASIVESTQIALQSR